MKNKKGGFFLVIKIILFFVFGILFLLLGFVSGYIYSDMTTKKTTCSTANSLVLDNPIKEVIQNISNANNITIVDPVEISQNKSLEKEVVDAGKILFNDSYINYILVSLGTGYLHRSNMGFGNPVIEFNLVEEVWNAELIDGKLVSNKGPAGNKDLVISVTKEVAVEALLSKDIKQFLKDSYTKGDLRIEMVAGNAELFSKGYLDMYKDLTGEDISGTLASEKPSFFSRLFSFRRR
jgi:hypothetical protein